MISASFCSPDDVRAILARAISRKSDRAGRYTLEELVAQGQCVKVTDASGQIIGAYIVQAQGPELWVLLAGGRASVEVLARLLEQQGRDFDSIGFATERPGLVKKAKREGYEVARYIMRKKLK